MPQRRFDIVVVGGINSDFVLRGQRVPDAGETTVMDSFFQGPGGKGANQAVAASRLGARVAMVACVGNDDRAKSVIQNLRREGVHTGHISRSKTFTGVALILVDASGEKSIGACMGANYRLSTANVRSARELFENCKVVLMQLEVPDAALIAAAKLAKKSGAKVILDPAPPRKIPAALLSVLDLIRPNFSEAEFLAGVKVTDRASARRAADILRRKGVGAVAMQCGDGGDFLGWDGGEVWLPLFKVKAVDATGAGDAFAAGMAVALAEGKPFPEAGRMGSAAAAIKITKMGAQAGLPTRRALDQFLRKRS